MSDRYLNFSQSGLGNWLVSQLGLPTPPALQRGKSAWSTNDLSGQKILHLALLDAQMTDVISQTLHNAGAERLTQMPADGDKVQAVVVDATGVQTVDSLYGLYVGLNPVMRKIKANGRIILVGRPAQCADPAVNACAAALTGFTRSLAKEVGGKGITVQLLQVAHGNEPQLNGALRFFLSKHSAYITGQILNISYANQQTLASTWSGNLVGKVAVVTGAARGIGAAIAEVFAREGAQVIGVDHPSQTDVLNAQMKIVNGTALSVDITAADAAEQMAAAIQAAGGADIIVHNAGVTRDKMLANMTAQQWSMVLNINLGAIININNLLLKNKLIKPNGSVMGIASIAGIAGNRGQTNYGATKSAVIGYVSALSAQLAEQGIRANAIAPGFIETAMTAAIPLGIREAGRRLSSLSQGGLPLDIAEAVAFLSSPAASGISGQTLRVCGQNLVGA